MHVHHCLPRISPDVDSDVVSGRSKCTVDSLTRGSDESQNVADLDVSEVEDVRRRVDG